MDWLENQNLVMDDFVVMSCSAGAVAVQAYANEIIRKFPAKRRAIVVDSYAGIAHDKVDAKLFKSYNLCESDIFDWSPALKAACFNQTLKVPDMLEASIKANPSVPFIFINSKAGTFYTLQSPKLTFSSIRFRPTRHVLGEFLFHKISRQRKILRSTVPTARTVFKISQFFILPHRRIKPLLYQRQVLFHHLHHRIHQSSPSPSIHYTK